jgi:DNA gyrase subunit B
VLEGLEAVRKRPGMYIGSTDARGLMHCLWELIDNSVDEAVAGHGSDITVTLHSDGSVSVADLGRGVPVDIEPRTGLTGVELVFTKLHAGGKFGAGSYATSGGLHGVGASVVNALSQRLDVEVDREGKTWAMSFHRGEPGIFHDVAEASPTSRFEAFEKTSELRVAGKAKKGVTGTRVRFWPDPEIFGGKVFFGLEELTERSRQTAYLVPGLSINLDDATGDTPVRTTYCAAGGLADFLEFLAPDQPVVGPWHFSGDGQFEETVPVLDDSGKLVSKDLVRDVHVDVVLQWGTGYDTVSKSFVNIIQTPKGGTHQQGFDAGLVKTLRAEIEKNARKLKVGKDKVEKEDIVAGLTVIVAVRVPEPQFEGQTKEVLGTPGVKAIVSAVVAAGFAEKFASTRREDKAFTQIVQEKIVAEMKTRLSARALKETQRRKNALEASTLPTKLVDCRTKETEGSELFIVEGDSALGTAKLARDSEHQALLPIRGKILNTQKASVQDMLDNAECAAIIQVIGAGSGRTFDLSQARYGKIIIMSDADVDGAHIRTLLLTLFFRYMRPLVEAGRVYAAVPPLHRVVVNGRGKTPPEIIYTYSEDELNALLASLSRAGKTYREPIQRYKGLGEMDADQLAETTMNRGDRTLRRVRVSDAEAAATVFELLMGNDVAPRRDFIVSGPGVSRDRIDA